MFAFPRPEANTTNEDVILKNHLARTGSRVITRFPPEPNGYLHIGHAKAMLVDFGVAEASGGRCFLRFDDTNPDTEKQEYIDHIKEAVEWMGYHPDAITYTSDYFDELYACAVCLIKADQAYVCQLTSEEIKAHRAAGLSSPWATRSIAESLDLFSNMCSGKVDSMTLRMRTPDGTDMVAYRVKHASHHRTGNRWKVYPSYDFAHCIVDSLEDITHSLCTKEFESRRPCYFWLLDVLGMYKPYVWEYGRLEIADTVLSKRKIKQLVEDKLVDGWDDPRLLTLSGLRRRGVQPGAIKAFCESTGLSRSEGVLDAAKLDSFIRQDLDETAPRALGVLDPVRLVIEDLPADAMIRIECNVFPGRSSETYEAILTQTVYIDRADFREEDSKKFFGLAPGKAVFLRYACRVLYTGHSLGPDGRVEEVRCRREPAAKVPKGVLAWVGADSAVCTAMLYSRLLLPEGTANPDSKQAIETCRLSPKAAELARSCKPFQLERVGYFCGDKNSTKENIIINRTVSLREASSKNLYNLL